MSTPKQAIIRCDAAPDIGTGHVVRCLALAQALRARGWLASIFALPGSRAMIAGFGDPAIEVVEHPDADSPSILQVLHPAGCDLLVVDSYRLGSEYLEALSSWAHRRLILVDWPSRPVPAEMLLDPSLGRSSAAYSPWIAPGARLLLGPSYALLRPPFAQARARALNRRVNGDGLLSLLVALGGGQQRSAVACALEGIRLSGLDLDVHVIGSDGAPASDLIGAARLTRHQATSAIHELMVSCDAAIGAGGGSSWERCCLGLPTLVVVVAENQSENAAAIERAGAGEQLGRSADVDPQSIAKALKALAGNPARLRKMALSAAQLCDGHGAQRVVGELDPRLAQSGEAVILRPVAPSDAEQMFAWQQGPAVRRYAHNPLPPTWEEHVDWLSRRLSTPTSGAVSIIELNGRPAGVLRMDPVSAADWDLPIETPAFLVSILVDPSRQGNGVGLAALAAARDLIPYATLCAEVLPANDASHRLFRRAGYREHSTGRYRLAPPDRPA